jgi:hypothetical protein
MKTGKGRGLARKTIDLIDAIVEIAEAIQPCSVRALAYQLFNRKLIPSMAKQQTQKVSRVCTIAREKGYLPWSWIVDPTREVECVPTWEDPEGYARAVQRSYRRNKWDGQPVHLSLWSEKSTIQGTLQPVLDQYEIPFQVLHGWSGATPVWDAAQAALKRDKPTIIFYVGDYDPSGMGMSDLDLPGRLARYTSCDPSAELDVDLFAWPFLRARNIDIIRIALTRDHAEMLGPDTRFPASDKKDDSRYEWFVRTHGQWCWELDALSPNTLRSCVEEAILARLDRESWDRYARVEEAERERIIETCETWTSILGQDQEYSDPAPDAEAEPAWDPAKVEEARKFLASTYTEEELADMVALSELTEEEQKEVIRQPHEEGGEVWAKAVIREARNRSRKS